MSTLAFQKFGLVPSHFHDSITSFGTTDKTMRRIYNLIELGYAKVGVNHCFEMTNDGVHWMNQHHPEFLSCLDEKNSLSWQNMSHLVMHRDRVPIDLEEEKEPDCFSKNKEVDEIQA